ncbi:MAG: pyridoxal 5'-phosphate synthase glutaminase subunit PdxT [Gammaproteobacteria bacterium]|nr:pyridoxal 5'-phosphate synthase glutaminase subunit PdxT [Gammaproteobacteria bacterium]
MGPVGILALQGAYQQHADLLDRLGVEWCWVRSAQELAVCVALILPGGESTAMTHLLHTRGLFEPLRSFAQTHPIMGSCAGLILMGHTDDARVHSLDVLDIQVARNGYGRQLQSFQSGIDVELGQGMERFPAVFIRAPRIIRVGAAATVLARHNDHPVLVAQGRHLGMSFHPELTDDTRIHRCWLEGVSAGAMHTLSREACA